MFPLKFYSSLENPRRCIYCGSPLTTYVFTKYKQNGDPSFELNRSRFCSRRCTSMYYGSLSRDRLARVTIKNHLKSQAMETHKATILKRIKFWKTHGFNGHKGD